MPTDPFHELRKRYELLSKSVQQGDPLISLLRDVPRFASLPDCPPFETKLPDLFETRAKPTHAYNIRHVEYLVASGSDFLSRAEAYLQEGEELALRAMTDLLARFKSEEELRLLETALMSGHHAAELAGLSAKLQELEESAANDERDLARRRPTLAPGRLDLRFRIWMKAQRVETAARLDAKGKEIEYMRSGISLARIFAAEVDRVSKLPGHALNHSDRIERARRAFCDLMAEAYARLRAAAEGLELVFSASQAPDADPENKAAPFPVLDAEEAIGYTARLRSWARSTAACLDRIRQREIEVRLILQGTKDFTEYVCEVSQMLHGLSGLEDLRCVSANLRAVPKEGFKQSSSTEVADLHRAYRGTVHVSPPEDTPDSSLHFHFGDALLSDTNRDIKASHALRNVDPVGTWKVVFEGDPPPDFFLEIVVKGSLRAKPSTDDAR